MKSINKKTILIFLIALIILLIIIMIGNQNKNKTQIENTIAKNDVIIEKITFSEITKTYSNGITTLSAKMVNNTKETQDFKIKIILKDEKNKEITNMIQKIENLESKKPKILSTGITGDYTFVKNIEFKIID